MASVLYNSGALNHLFIHLEFSVKLNGIFAALKLLKRRTLSLVHSPKSVEHNP